MNRSFKGVGSTVNSSILSKVRHHHHHSTLSCTNPISHSFHSSIQPSMKLNSKNNSQQVVSPPPPNCPFHDQDSHLKESSSEYEIPKNDKIPPLLKSFNEIPGPKPWPIVGNLLQMRSQIKDNYNPYLLSLMETYGEMVRLEILGQRILFISSPKEMEKLYKSEEKRLSSQSNRFYKESRGIILSPIEMEYEENWQETRQVFNIAMNLQLHSEITLPQLSELNSEFLKRLIKELRMESDGSFRLHDGFSLATRYAFDSVMKSFLGIKLTDELTSTFPFKIEDFVMNTIETGDLTAKFMVRPPYYKLFKTPLYKRFEECFDSSFEYGRYLMKRFKTENPSGMPRFYEHLLEKAQYHEKPEELVEAVMINFLQAGVDITVRMMIITFFRLAHHRDYQEKIYQECLEIFGEPSVDEITSEHGLQISTEQYKQLKHVKWFLDEVFRVSPATYSTSARILREDLEIGGYLIPKDTLVGTVQYHTCMREENVPRPNEFLPERWERNSPWGLPNSLILAPFGMGARKCPGRRIATTEIHCAIVNLVRHFKLSHDKPDKFPEMSLDQSFFYMDTKKEPLYLTPRKHLSNHLANFTSQ